jgi:hypothetical protein
MEYKLLRKLENETEFFVVEEGCIDTCKDYQREDERIEAEHNPQYKIEESEDRY